MSRSSILISAVLMLAIFISALSIVYCQHCNRQLFVQLQNIHKQQDQIDIDYGRLQLEQSAWATYGRIEQLARDKKNMHVPAVSQRRFIVREY